MSNQTAKYEQVRRNIVNFLKKTYQQHDKKNGIIAVSGGIDSAVSLSLLVQALGRERVHALLLPYGDQEMQDAQTIVAWNKLPKKNIQISNIKPIVDGVLTAVQNTLEVTQAADKKLAAAKSKEGEEMSAYRLGNIMARARMIVVYDAAKKLDALVCGTENKSEKYLGYFTRFGDEASDMEPIQGLYKSHVRELAMYLELPAVFLEKSPSAGLWEDQTDENELCFSYEVADQVFEQLIEKQSGLLYLQLIEGSRLAAVTTAIAQQLPEVSRDTITAVLKRVQSQQFKHEVPYTTETY
jgi:NAD+ synthase